MLSTCAALAVGDTACAFALGILVFMLIMMLGGLLFTWLYKPAFFEYKRRTRGYLLLQELMHFDQHGPWPARLRPGSTVGLEQQADD